MQPINNFTIPSLQWQARLSFCARADPFPVKQPLSQFQIPPDFIPFGELRVPGFNRKTKPRIRICPPLDKAGFAGCCLWKEEGVHTIGIKNWRETGSAKNTETPESLDLSEVSQTGSWSRTLYSHVCLVFGCGFPRRALYRLRGSWKVLIAKRYSSKPVGQPDFHWRIIWAPELILPGNQLC